MTAPTRTTPAESAMAPSLIGLLVLFIAVIGIVPAASADELTPADVAAQYGVADSAMQRVDDALDAHGASATFTSGGGGLSAWISTAQPAKTISTHGDVFSQGAMPESVHTASSGDGWTSIVFAQGTIRYRLVGSGAPSSTSIAGNDVAQSDVMPGVDQVTSISGDAIEELVVEHAQPWNSDVRSFSWQIEIPANWTAIADDHVLSIYDPSGLPVENFSAPLVEDQYGRSMRPTLSWNAETSTASVVYNTAVAGLSGDVVVDPTWETTGGYGSGGYILRLCNNLGDQYAGCRVDNTWAPDAAWSWAQNTSGKFTSAVNQSVVMNTIANNVSIANGSYGAWRYSVPTGVLGRRIAVRGYWNNPSGYFGCLVYGTNTGTTSVSAGAVGNFAMQVDNVNSGVAAFGTMGIQLVQNSGATHTPTGTNQCYIAHSTNGGETVGNNFIVLVLNDQGDPSQPTWTVTPDPNKWYGPSSSIPLAATLNDQSATSGSGILQAWIKQNASQQAGIALCTPYNGAGTEPVRPCATSTTLTTTFVPSTSTGLQQGTNTLTINDQDFGQRITTGTSTATYKYDSVAPSAPTVANIANAVTDGTAVVSWSAATDATSGVDHYLVKIWPDGQTEPCTASCTGADAAYDYQSTGSSEPYFNARLGVMPASASWKWNFRVKAVDAAGNVSSASSIADIGTSTAFTTNHAVGTSTDQATTQLGAGIQIGDATGNLSISATDLTIKADGADLVAGHTYNHQDSVQTCVLLDTGCSSPNAISLGASWSMGRGVTATWERRLVRGDDGSASGQGAADSGSPIKSLTYIDETGTRWPFTPTSSSATTFASPIGLDADLVHIATGTSGPADDHYTLSFKGGSTLEFDENGLLTFETTSVETHIRFFRDAAPGRVTSIEKLGVNASLMKIDYNADNTVSGVSDSNNPRIQRFSYDCQTRVLGACTDGPYLTSLTRSNEDNATPIVLSETDYSWGAGSGTSARAVTGVDEWVYSDDSSTTGVDETLKHHWTIAYNGTNQVGSVTEQGSASRAIGTGGETIPAVPDTITGVSYAPLTAGGSSGVSMDVLISRGTSADAHAYGDTVDSVDLLARSRKVQKPIESGASFRAVDLTDYDSQGNVVRSESNRRVDLPTSPTQADIAGDVTGTTYDASGNVTNVTEDSATSGVPDQSTDYADYDSAGNPATETSTRTTFVANWAYPINSCVDSSTANGTFKVTTAGTSGGEIPAWPTSGSITSGTATFTRATCTLTPQTISTSHEYVPATTFRPDWTYSAGTCINAPGATFAVTIAGTSGPIEPNWPGSGSVASGSVTFTKQSCTVPVGGSTEERESQNQSGIRDCTYYTATGQVDVSYQLDGVDCPATANLTDSHRVMGSKIDNTYVNGRLNQTTTDEQTTKFTFDAFGEELERRLIVDSADASKDIVTTTKCDQAGRTTRVTTTASSGSTRSTSTEYTMTGEPTVVTVPNASFPTGLVFDTPYGDRTVTSYDARGLPYLTLQTDGNIATKSHDGLQREVSISVPHAPSNGAPAATTIAYFLSGAKKSKADPAGIVTTYDSSIDPGGVSEDRPARIDSPITGTKTFAYTSSGELASSTTSAGTTANSYDAAGNLIKVTYPDSAITSNGYDERGNSTFTAYTPSGGSADSVRSIFTKDDKLASSDQLAGVNSSNAYSATSGQLSQVDLSLDGSSWTQQVRSAYDAAGRISSQTLEAGATDLTTGYDYEAKSGRLATVHAPNGVDESYTYDEHGRAASLKALQGTSWIGGDTYSYDAQSRVASRTRRENGNSYATTYAYDPAGQVVSETSPNKIVRTYAYGNGNASSFGTDLQTQQIYIDGSVALPGSIALDRYSAISKCATTPTTCFPGNTPDHDAALAALKSYTEPGAVIDPSAATGVELEVAHFLRQNDAASWFGPTEPPLGACITASGHTFVATSHSGDNLTGAVAPSWNLGAGSTTTDNHVTWTEGASGCDHRLTVRSYTYDTNSPTLHQLMRADGLYGAKEYFAYDALGRQIYRGASAFVPGTTTPNQTWDVLDRPLTLKNDAGQTVTMTWLRDQPLLASYAVSGTGLTHYQYFDASDRLVYTNVTGTGGWTTEYAYDQSGLKAFKTGSNWYYLDRSTRGDITAIRNDSGALQATARYSAYGELAWKYEAGVTAALTDALAHDYNGRDGVVDLGGGLQWMMHRIYSSEQARFVSADSLEATEGSLQSAYNYGNGDPIYNADPSGRVTVQCYLTKPLLTWLGNVLLSSRVSCDLPVYLSITVCLYRGGALVACKSKPSLIALTRSASVSEPCKSGKQYSGTASATGTLGGNIAFKSKKTSIPMSFC